MADLETSHATLDHTGLTGVGGGGSGVTACLAQRTTSQSTGSNPTAIAFNAADLYDPDGWHDPSSSNTRLTCPTGKGGKMFVLTGSAEWDGSGSASCYIMFRKGGTTTIGQNLIPMNAYTGTSSAPVFLNDGDYVEMLIANVTTGNVIVSDAPCTFGIVG